MKLYNVEKRLGRGGFGYVDLVTMTDGPLEGKKLALKTIKARDIIVGMTEQEKEAAVNEAKVLQRLRNSHIVRFHHAWWESEDTFKILIELCEDGTLKNAIQSQNEEHFDNLQVTDWSIQLALAIKYLHERKILHRDIKHPSDGVVYGLNNNFKPENIFLCRGKEILKLGDFGLFKLFEVTLGYTKTGPGTPSYMPPEAHRGEKCSYPADVWAFSCVLFELINLKQAFTAPNKLPLAIALKVIQNSYQEFERDFCKDLILECFEDDQRARPTIGQVLEALNEVQKELEQNLETPGNFENLTLTGDSTSVPCGDGSEVMTTDLGTSLSEEKTREHANVLSCSNSESSKTLNFRTSAACLYEHKGEFPRLLWANNDSFCSFGFAAADAFLCDLTSDGLSKAEIGETVCATLRSDGKIVTGNKKGEVFLWSNIQKLRSQKIQKIQVHEMCSLSDERVFTASSDGTVKVLGPKLETISKMEGSKKPINAIGNYKNKVATGDVEGIIRYYDLNEEFPKTFNEHSNNIWSVSLDKELIASGSSDTKVVLWKPSESDKPVFVMRHDHWVFTVMFGHEASSNKLYSCSEDKSTAIWNIETGQRLNSIKHPGSAWCLDIHPDGHLAATGHSFGVSLLDIRMPKIVKEIKGHSDGEKTRTWDVKFSPNGKQIGFTEYKGAVKIVDLRS